MKAMIIVLMSVLWMPLAHAKEGNAVNGQKLFAGSKCLSCHGTDVFTKPDRKIKNLAMLESQVRRCDANSSTNWYDDEILDVVAYLNKTYYKF